MSGVDGATILRITPRPVPINDFWNRHLFKRVDLEKFRRAVERPTKPKVGTSTRINKQIAMTTPERQLEDQLIGQLRDLKYEYRADIRDRAALEKNFREKFEALNYVHLTEGEFQRLLDEIVTPDVFTAAHTLRNRNSFSRVGSVDRISLVSEKEDGWLFSGRLLRIRTDANVVNSCFLSFYFQLETTKNKIRSVAVGQTMPSLNTEILNDFPVLTANLAEQQKIADCLTSLDELIAAEGRKVKALKAHKKGLMQQLFPREGETLPRLRFPEFRDADEWTQTTLGELGTLIAGLTYSPDDVRDEGLLVLRSSNIQNGEIALDDNVYVTPEIKSANLSRANDILICVRNGSKPLIGKNALIPDGMPLCTHGAFMTVFRARAPHFVFQLFQTAAYQKQVAGNLGATINSINGSQLLKYHFIVPGAAEQQRIADCLSILDSRIAAEADMLAALKTHKKGLMQQLFPWPEDAQTGS
jgi:restriction endonuclease S subunit